MQAVRILFSEWIMIADQNAASEIYNKLAPLTQKKDRVLVQELGQDSAWDKLLISDDDFRSWLAHTRF